MTRDEFEDRYELLERITEGEVETHHALHPSGAVVMVHLVRGTRAFQKSVLDAVGQLGRGARKSKVLYLHDVEGLKVVVTRFAMDFVSLEDWFAENGAPLRSEGVASEPFAPSPPPADPSIDADAPGGGPGGEFTRMFKIADVHPPSGPSKTREPSEEVTGTDRPGEFTRMFRAVGGADSPTQPIQKQPEPAEAADDLDPWTDPARRPPASGDAVPPSLPSWSTPPKEPDAPAARDDAWSDALLTTRPPAKDTAPVTPPDDQTSRPAPGGEFTRIFGRDDLAPQLGEKVEPPPVGRPAETQPSGGGDNQGAEAAGLASPRLPNIPGGAARLPRPQDAVHRVLPPQPLTPRIPVAPRVDHVAGALSGLSRGGGGVSSSDAVEGTARGERSEAKPDPQAAKREKRRQTVTFAVGLTLVVVVSAVLILFFSLRNFSAPAPADLGPTGEGTTADTLAG